MVLPFRNNPFRWKFKKFQGSFSPKGKFVEIAQGKKYNPVDERYDTTWAARLFVGLGTLRGKSFTLDTLIMIVRAFLKKSAQVIIINLGVDKEKFEKAMIKLAEHLCKVLDQRSVIVEVQRNGMTMETLSIVP